MGRSNKSDDEYSYIGDKGDIGFIDLDNSKTICSYNPSEESQVVRISVPFPIVNEKPRSGFVGETIYDSVTIENLTDDPLDLWSITIYDSKPENTFTMSLMEPPNANSDEQYIQRFVETSVLDDRILRPDRPLVVWLSCKPKDIGLHSAAVHFTVGDETIERLIFVLSEDKISQSLSSTRLYYRPRKKKLNVVDVHTPDVKFVAGRRPSSNRSSSYRLPDYPIPRYIRDMVNSQQIPDVVTEGLNVRNHSLFFKTLLAMEEIKLEEDMGAYNMEGVTMNGRRDRYLSLEVPGLAERRPSLVNGDFIFVKLGSGHGTTNVAYQGYIHRVEAEEVHLMFDQDFHNCHHESNLYNVQFSYNRVSMRRLYQAVEASERLEINFLFPSLDGSKLVQPAPLVPISCILNEEQMSAVEMILSCKGGSPYVIHGPPGTGKTVTLIEAILQIYIKSRKSRILVCAPSNSAADHILERIVAESSANIQTEEIFRLNAYTRPFDDVNPDHIKFSCVENLMFKCPSRWDLKKYRIVISTYTSASLLYSEGVKRGHFSYIFLDEAGQASEPETMVPLSQLHSRDTVVILAGDPMQLGPVLFSKDAERHGLGKSYLERLLEFEAYSSGNRNFMTKLVRNYRTHPDILHLPSELFYDGELIPCKEVDSNFLTSLEDLLPNKEFPVLFVGIQGCDEREGSNPSWFNRIEASKVAEIIRLLTEQKGLEDQDIGVITPYRQQVLKIRTALEDLGKPSIKVGSVEQFQGQEKQVIIISTVRSTVKHNEFDRVHYLGFLSNPKRFNVAITRARSLLIVMGNPHILCKDPYWNQILWYCVDNTSYKGCFLPERVELSIVEDSIQPSDSQWGQNGDNSEPARAEWSDNGQWGEEQNSWDPSTGQWGEKQSNWEPSNGQWGELQNNPEPSNHQWDNDNSWEPSKDQWGDEGNSWEPSNDQWAKYNNSNPPKDQWGEKQNSWEPFNDHRGEGKNNWDPSTEQWGEKPNHWEPSNDQWDEEKNNRDPLEDQWGEKQNCQESSEQWGEKQNNWEPSKDQWGEEQNNWEPSKDQWGEEQNWEPSKDQWGEEQKDQEPSKDDWGGEGNSWKPSNYQRGVEEKSGWQSNGVRGDEGKTREQSCGQRGAKQSSSKSSKDQEPSKVDWGGVGNSWKSSNHQQSDERKSGSRSNGERGDEGKTTEQYNVQQGAKKSSSKSCKDQEPSKDDWSGEGNSWKPSNHQHSVEGKSGWQANGVRGDEGKTREQSYGQQGAKQSSSKSTKDQEPSKDEWGGHGNSWKSSNNQRSDERESGWGSNGEGGDEGKNTEQSNVQQGVKQSSLKSSKDQEPSKDEWGGVGSSWKSSNHQRGDKAKSGWQSNGEKGDEGKTREQSYGQRGVKQGTSKSSKSRWVKAGDNVNTSSEAMAGLEEISDRLSKLKSRGKGKKIAPTGWKY